MRISQCLLSTTKESPADAELISHQLMIRAGLIRKLSSGLYSWLPLGFRVLQKVSQIVREEMDRIGAQEMLMPAIQPAELWQESGRWDDYGPLMLTMKDRNGRDFCFGPTHEEVITDIARRELQSYKQLPQTFYQIQTKFRDELRPRFGVMRAREFIMKDAYSFHHDEASLETTYQAMHAAYSAIFTRLGLEFRVVLADAGEIGGEKSQEFHVLADSGEDLLAYCPDGDYAANVERATTKIDTTPRPAPSAEKALTETPDITSVPAQAKFLKLPVEQVLKTLIVKGADCPAVALLLRGDHELNEIKAQNHPLVANPLTMVDEKTLQAISNAPKGFVGPFDLEIPMIADHAVARMADFSCGANQKDKHYVNVNWERDLNLPDLADLRNVVEGDLSPDGKGTLAFCRGIEVGHIFQLGTKYTSALSAQVADESGRPMAMPMGCYGIGVSRIVAAAIEQNHDEQGICWPDAMAPYQFALICLANKEDDTFKAAEDLYQQCQSAGLDVMFDDRFARAGVKFSDMELIGIPHQVVIGAKGLKNGIVEYKHRQSGERSEVPVEALIGFLADRKS